MTEAISLVTGGAGFLGRPLVAALRRRGRRVRVLDPAAATLAPEKDLEAVAGSILDAKALAAACADVATVYHLAATAGLWERDPGLYDRVNVEGTRTVLEAARRAGARVVCVSSAVTLAGPEPAPAPVSETSPRPPLSAMCGAYARSKWLALRLAEDSGATVVWPTVPIGPGDTAPTPPTRMVTDLLAGRVPAYLQCRMNWIGAADCAEGIALAGERGTPGEGYILGGENLWFSEFLRLLEDVSGQPMPRRRVPYALALAAAFTQEWLADAITHRPPQAPLAGVRLARRVQWFDSSKAVRALDWHPRPLRQPLEEAVEWLRETGRV